MTQYKKIYELAILTIFLIVSFALASCNSEDSGGSGTAATTTNSNSDLNGVYKGSREKRPGYFPTQIWLYSGSALGIEYLGTPVRGRLIASFYQADFTASGGSLSGSMKRTNRDSVRYNTTVSGAYVKDMSATVKYFGDESGEIALSFDSDYSFGGDIKKIATTWTGTEEGISLTIADDGSISGRGATTESTGRIAGCNYSGSISGPVPDGNIYKVALTTSDCDNSSDNVSYTGLSSVLSVSGDDPTLAMILAVNGDIYKGALYISFKNPVSFSATENQQNAVSSAIDSDIANISGISIEAVR